MPDQDLSRSPDFQRLIYLMWEFRAVDGPFATLDEIPPKIWEIVDEDPDYTLEVWRSDYVDIKLRANPWWREEGNDA